MPRMQAPSSPWRAAVLGAALASCCLGKMSGGAANSKVKQYYNPMMTQAFAALATLTYCAGDVVRGVPSGIKKAVGTNCGNLEGSFCLAAGFHVVPDTVAWVNMRDAGQDNSLFAIVAEWKRIGQPKDVHHAGGCLIAFRGSIGVPRKGANWQRNAQSTFVNASAWPDCLGCQVHQGYYEIWQRMEPSILTKLRMLQCKAEDNSPLFITGHSLGGAVSYMAIYALQSMGFDVQLPYIFAAPRPGNSYFITSFARLFERMVPLFLISHSNDRTPRMPSSGGFKHAPFQVFYGGKDPENYTLCYDPTDEKCGMNQYAVQNMSSATTPVPTSPHCLFPMAPYSNICEFTGVLWVFSMGNRGSAEFERVCTRGRFMPFPAHSRTERRRLLMV